MQPRLMVDVYEIEYSCSPGGIDKWEISVYSENDDVAQHYFDFDTAGAAVEFVLDKYPTSEIQFIVKSLEWYHANEEFDDN